MDELKTEYFANTNSLFKAFIEDISEVKKSFGSSWDKLSIEKQALLINEFYNLEENRSKNGDSVEDNVIYNYENYYSLLNVNSEKALVADFENDTTCWTWLDEHSTPFSWKSKSQENLRLADLFIESEIANKLNKNKAKVVKTSSDPQNKTTNFPKDQTDISSTNEIEMMFQRFGLKSTVSDETSSDNSISKMLHKKLVTKVPSSPLDETLVQEKNEKILTIEEVENIDESLEGLNKIQNSENDIMNVTNMEMSDCINKHNQKGIDFRNKDFKITLNRDVGESSTDDFVSGTGENLKELYSNIEKPFRNLSNTSDSVCEDDVVVFQPKSEAMAIKKTGFDFLDNW